MLSSKAKYALKSIVYLARQWPRSSILIADIAESERIPRKFLDTILLEMKNEGLLISKKGKGGGYGLAVDPRTVAVGRIIRLFDGPLAPVPCVSRLAYRPCPDCRDERSCQIRAVMQEARDAIAQVLDKTSLHDLMIRHPRTEPVLDYVI